MMYMKGKAFVISVDTLADYNQMKGRKIIANFNNDARLEKITIDGNGESIYYAVDEKNVLTGMNRVQCSKMYMNFAKGKIKKIAFLAKPDGKFMPPKEVKEDDKELDGFRWRISEKPTKAMILQRVAPVLQPSPVIIAKDSVQVKKIESPKNKKPLDKKSKKLP